MESKKELFFGSRMLTDNLNNYLLAKASIIIGLVREKILEGRAREVAAAILSTMSTAIAIAKLGRTDEFYNECVMLARGFFERIVNICYLLVCDDDKFEEYRLHTRQKAYRKLEQEFYAGDEKICSKFGGKKDLECHPEIQEALKKFSTNSGKEKKRWPDMSIPDRIKLIGDRSKTNISMFLLYQVLFYTDASEALHGSFYGLTFHTGAYEPNINHKNKAEIRANLQKNFTVLFWFSGELIHKLLVILSQDNNISEQLKYSTENSNNSYEIMEKVLKYVEKI